MDEVIDYIPCFFKDSGFIGIHVSTDATYGICSVITVHSNKCPWKACEKVSPFTKQYCPKLSMYTLVWHVLLQLHN